MGNASSSSSHSHSGSRHLPNPSSLLTSSSSSSSASPSAQVSSKDPNIIVDGGHVVPMGLYSSQPQDFSHAVVKSVIQERKLAPFYMGLEDYEEDYTEEDVVKELREADVRVEKKKADHAATVAAAAAGAPAPTELKSARKPVEGEPTEKEKRVARWYSEAVECPLCFLYYPPNMNSSRCCDQPICTECFVQIKRAEADATHLTSEPACCPYCMEPNFGVVYERPKPKFTYTNSGSKVEDNDSGLEGITSGLSVADVSGAPRSRRKSVNHQSTNVVTIDEIRPDWEAKLAAVKAVAARRANRRIVMRQVGDRLIPVGITSSREPIGPLVFGTGADTPDSTGSGNEGGLRRNRRRTGTGSGREGDLAQLLQGMGSGVTGPDIEELMMMEAMRLSLLEHEQQQAREAAAAAATGGNSASPATPATGTTATSPPVNSP